jgi:hypothetical protein
MLAQWRASEGALCSAAEEALRVLCAATRRLTSCFHADERSGWFDNVLKTPASLLSARFLAGALPGFETPPLFRSAARPGQSRGVADDALK